MAADNDKMSNLPIDIFKRLHFFKMIDHCRPDSSASLLDLVYGVMCRLYFVPLSQNMFIDSQR